MFFTISMKYLQDLFILHAPKFGPVSTRFIGFPKFGGIINKLFKNWRNLYKKCPLKNEFLFTAHDILRVWGHFLLAIFFYKKIELCCQHRFFTIIIITIKDVYFLNKKSKYFYGGASFISHFTQKLAKIAQVTILILYSIK